MSAEVSPSLATQRRKRKQRTCAVITNLRIFKNIEVKIPCYVHTEGAGWLHMGRDTLSSRGPKFKHLPCSSVLQQLMESAITLEANSEVFFRERLICEKFLCLKN